MNDLIQQAARLYASGQSLTQVSEALTVTIGFVRKALKITGTAPRPIRCKVGKIPDHSGHVHGPLLSRRTFDYDRAAALYLQGASLSQVANEVGATAEVVRKALDRMGIDRRARGAQPGSANHQFVGGVRARADGYLIQRGSRAKQLEHRVIAERALGRPLKADEVVHHINCNRNDNRPENLLICTQAYHMALHARMRRDPYWRDIERQAKTSQQPE